MNGWTVKDLLLSRQRLTYPQRRTLTMRDFIYLILMLILNGIGAYIAYRVITWFETGRTEVDSLRDFKPNVRKVK